MNANAHGEYRFPDVPGDVKRFLVNCVARDSLALMFQVHAKTIDRWVRSHGLPTVNVDGVRLFHLPEVRDWCTNENIRRCYDTTPLSERIRRVQ